MLQSRPQQCCRALSEVPDLYQGRLIRSVWSCVVHQTSRYMKIRDLLMRVNLCQKFHNFLFPIPEQLSL